MINAGVRNVHMFMCVWEFLLPVHNSLPAFMLYMITVCVITGHYVSVDRLGLFLFRNWFKNAQ